METEPQLEMNGLPCWEKEESADDKKNGSDKRSVGFLELFCYADSYDYFLMAMGTVGALGHGLAYPAFFYIFGKLVNSFGQNMNDAHKLTSQVTKYSLDIVYLGAVIWVCAWAEVACWMQTGQRQTNKLRMAYMNAILIQDVGFFDTDLTTGTLINSISNDTLSVQDAISEKLGNFLHFVATSVGGFIVGFSAVWSLCLVTVAVVPAIAVAGGFYAFAITRLTSDCQEAYRNAGIIAEETITQIRTVYSFTGEKKAARDFKESLAETLTLGYRGGLAKGLGLSASYSIVFFSWALIMWYGGLLISRGQTDGGQVTTAVFSAIIGGMAMGQAISNITALAKGKASAYDIFRLIHRKSASENKAAAADDATGSKKLSEVRGDIELRGVIFSYPSRPEAVIFKNLSLRIESGKTLALVGGSGSGKSTVISLIERFYDPLEGHVLLDGVDVRSLSVKWLRDQIGLVNQEPALFATSIAGNILYGNENATTEQVEAAAKAANAHDFITDLPNSYQTHVGEHGVQLSGGQKQRVAIARAMLKNPKLLLLDEATSALDTASERVVQAAIDQLMVGRTTVVIAHRLSTIKNVDTIAVMQNGEIVEMGTHDELLAKGNAGAYSTLVRLQELALSSDGAILSRASIKGNSGRTGSCSFRMSRTGSMRVSNASSDIVLRNDDDGDGIRDADPTASGGQRSATEKPSTSSSSLWPRWWKSCWWRLAKMNAPEWPYAVLGTVGSMLAGALNPAFALVISEVLKLYFEPDTEKMKRGVHRYSLAIIGLGTAALGVYVLQHYFFGVVGENLTARLREMMFRAMLRNEVGWFDRDENDSRRLMAHLMTDAGHVRAAIGDRMSLVVQNVTVCLTAFIAGFILEWRLTMLLLSAYPLLVTAAVSQQLCIKGFAGDLRRAHSRCSMIAGDAISNIRTVAAFNAEARVLSLFAESLAGPARRSFKRGHISGCFLGASQFAMYSTYALLFWYGAALIARGATDFGRVLQVFMVLMMTSFAIAETLSLTPDAVKGAEALETVLDVIDRKTEIDAGAGAAVGEVKGEIEMTGVEFAYPSRPGIAVLRGLDLRVPAGKSLALVGASGVGKSSVLAMVERFYDPAGGTVKIDGRDIRTLNLVELRRRIGLVPQEPALFATSVFSNIAYGGGCAEDEDGRWAEVQAAAEAANAHEFISGLPEGYATQVGERGIQLSGGQKQRIAIARAVLKNPAILLLDEATSALDTAAELVVQAALERVMRRRTTIVVAHRLSTILAAHSIAVLHQGRVVEHGSHSQLLLHQPHGAYARLIAAQFPSASPPLPRPPP